MHRQKKARLNTITDTELVKRIQQNEGKYEAFEVLIKRYQEKLYSAIRKIVSNHEDTNDILQNVFLKAWNNIDKFKGNSQIYTWLYRISYNESINFLNSNKKHIHADLDDSEHKNSQNLEADHIYNGDKIYAKLMSAVEQLPEKQKRVFNLKYFEEKKYTEIAEITGTTTGALKASYFHAVKKIEEFLKQD